MKKEAGKKLIEQRVEDFEKNAAVLKKKGHGETNIRSNYIDIFFEALGWNMKSHYDVHREFAQKDNSATKKVDYAFKVNGKVKFFVEAKEASVDLVNNRDAIYQAKRYAYSTNGKAPIVILTDFEEFRVFNVVKAPVYDNTDRELLKKYSFEYTDYLENWDLLWDTFSKEAVTAGSLDALRGKIDKNTKTMDADFLEQITSWRETLAKNIALRNKDLKVDEINESVQRILDRLIFIRNLEDREIEPENTLLDKTKKTENVYQSIVPLFRSLDHVYNGLLFKKHFSEELIVDDKVLKDIIKNMSYPVSPFQFDVIEPEILGRIYEKFLGSKIRLTENHQAKIEEKMEVRKAGGVYYTPEYIVNYIVENTVGKKIVGDGSRPSLTPEEIRDIKICDPACGSGSFLLGAYSCLLDYHEKWYAKASAEDRKKYKADFYKTKEGEVKVTLEKRGDILRNNIFGVDIDKEATEVAIMSLYLKMLDEGFDKGERDLFFIKGHVLPDMTDNVKCGNSLIGTDYFDGKLEIDFEEMKEIKPFDWEKEFDLTPGPLRQAQCIASPQGEGRKEWGFDCVIGNPPYGFHQIHSEIIKPYLKKKYLSSHGSFEHYFLFYDKSLSLLNSNGIHGFIVPVTWLTIPSADSLRRYICDSYKITNIIWLPEYVFENAKVNTLISIIYKQHIADLINIDIYDTLGFVTDPIVVNKISQDKVKESDYVINIFQSMNDSDLITKIEQNSKRLDLYAKPCSGYNPYEVGKGLAPKGGVHTLETVQSKPYHSEIKINDDWKPEIVGRDLARYHVCITQKRWIKYGPWLAAARDPENFLGKRILVQEITGGQDRRIVASYYEGELYHSRDVIPIKILSDDPHPFYLLGIINSRLITWYHHKSSPKAQKGLFPKVLVADLSKIPVSDIKTQDDKQKHDTLVSLVDQMLSAQKECRSAKSDSDKKLYEQKISMLDKKIDDLVYKLYGLTDEEIKIVEG